MAEKPNITEVRTAEASSRVKLRHVHEITGYFVLLVIAVSILAVIWTARSQRWFRSNVDLRIILPGTGAAGIRQGSEVYFLGTLVGSVHAVTVDAAGRMEANTSIRHDFFRFVRADSSAVVKRKFGVAGDSFFEITRGVGAPLPEMHASIVCNAQVQSALESAIDEIRMQTLLVLGKTSTGLEAWTALATNLIASRERVDELLKRADGIVSNVEQGKGTVGKLLTDSSTAEELNHILSQASHSMGQVAASLTNFAQASSNLQSASTNFPGIATALRNEADDLPGLVMETQNSMREVERLVKALQQHWLIRKYVNKTNPPPVRSSAKTGS